jgi:hypothetical protein
MRTEKEIKDMIMLYDKRIHRNMKHIEDGCSDLILDSVLWEKDLNEAKRYMLLWVMNNDS